MRVIGLDPGTATTGFAILEKKENKIHLLDYGCISTKANPNLAERLVEIANSLQTLIDLWQPSQAGIEEIFFTTNVKTAISVAQARGVIMEKLQRSKIKISEYNPLTVKNAICGYGKAQKPEIQRMIQILFQLKNIPKPDDAADAIAIAYCLLHDLKHQISQTPNA
jgi:crossover junction endodeoxyribonuclease RuvC